MSSAMAFASIPLPVLFIALITFVIYYWAQGDQGMVCIPQGMLRIISGAQQEASLYNLFPLYISTYMCVLRFTSYIEAIIYIYICACLYLHVYVHVRGFPGDSVVKNLPTNAWDAEDPGSIPQSGRSPRRGNDNTLHYSCLESPMDGRAWRAIVHGVAKSRAQLSTHPHACVLCVCTHTDTSHKASPIQESRRGVCSCP